MEMLVLQHIFREDRNTSMVERLQKSEIPVGWDLWNFQSTFAENLHIIPTFSTKTKWNLAECSEKLCNFMYPPYFYNRFIED